MMLSLVCRPTYEDDLLNNWTEIRHHNSVAADQLIVRLYERCLDLVDYPEIGPARPFRKGKDLAPDVFCLTVSRDL